MSAFIPHLNDTLRRLVPVMSTLLLLALSFAPLPGVRTLALPPLALMGVFYWGVYRPDRFGILAAFVTGMLADLLMGAPVGITAFLYAAVQRAGRSQQRLFKSSPFYLLWTGYIVCQLATAAVQWLCWSWLAGAAYQLLPFAVQLALGAMLFPLVYGTLSRLHTAFLHYQA